MEYKALMLDIDGTVVPYDYNALPSDRLAQTLRIAQNKIAICFVTGRSLFFLKPVLNKIGMRKGYAVVNNGANVVDLATNRSLYNKPINKKDLNDVCDLLEKEKITFYIKQGLHDANYYGKPYQKGLRITTASMIFSEEFYESETIDEVQKKLSGISDLTVYKIRHRDGFGLNIQHVNATKLHGVEIVLKALCVDSKHAIGVGDGVNDFPLLMACGLKVAMGNAVADLKAIADYIAPTVDNDGVAEVINKFVL